MTNFLAFPDGSGFVRVDQIAGVHARALRLDQSEWALYVDLISGDKYTILHCNGDLLLDWSDKVRALLCADQPGRRIWLQPPVPR